MNIAEFSISKKVITYTLTVVALYVGYLSFNSLPRLEDPEFAIKQALVITNYPGASAYEVEKEVTEVIEKAAQQMGQLKFVESWSERGLSKVKVWIKDEYQKTELPQVWDELRRKIQDAEKNLPPGTAPPIINDDFGDVYGVYLALHGEGYSYAELKKIAELLRRELLTVQDVKKVVLSGIQKETIYVEMSKTKMASLDITEQEIFDALRSKNLPVDAGKFKVGDEYLAINPTGEYKSEKQFGDLLISSKEGKLIYLKDVASIIRDYQDPPGKILRFNGEPAIGIGISTVLGGNAVTVGEGVIKRLAKLEGQIPLGMELDAISMQSESVTKAIDGFIINLIEAIVIVILVLLFAMGLRSGLIIGFILLLTIAATFVIMGMQQITLERISLGALIIALGMLVDNAIVVVDGMKVKMEKGIDGLSAAKEIVGQNSIPLLGATAVAVLAFAAIGTLSTGAGEYTQSLFYVILISLSLSWLTAVTTTPLLTKQFILSKKSKKKDESKNGNSDDPYAGKLFVMYRKGLVAAVKNKWITIGVVVVIFVLSIFGFGLLKNQFFPTSTSPMFIVEIQFREGIHITETNKRVGQVENYLRSIDGITDISSLIGGGHTRFILTYDTPIDASINYASMLVSVTDYELIDQIYIDTQNHIEEMFPDATINVKKFNLGPATGGKLQLRIMGPDPNVLRSMASTVKEIIMNDPESKALRDEWGARVKVIRPVLIDERARRLGIDRPLVGQTILSRFQGYQTGVYREGIELIPIVARAPEIERLTIEDLRDLQIYSPTAQQNVPLLQVVSGLRTEIEDARTSRFNRTRMIQLHFDPRTILPAELLARVKPKIETALKVDLEQYYGKSYGDDPYEGYTAETIPLSYHDKIPLKDMPGYYLSWAGELEMSSESTKALAGYVPIFFGMMILVVIFLFNAFRQPLIIWLTVPLAIIGVTLGLLVFDQPFGFMALLGFMSLAGMLIKNAIVLIDQIDIERREGKEDFYAIVDSGVSRMRPVMLAAGTTILGMLPLLQDDFFIGMAITIMFGLGFASVLTLIFVPTLYATFFKVKIPTDAK
jgi:multidrug efflux pump subunit AcrB